jgi:hypothetical protein
VPKDAFVIMPFSATPNHSEEEWKNTYEYVIAPAITNAGYSCSRAEPERGSLIVSIVDKLHSSWLVVADLTDRNANVFYELGVRHALSKRTILLSQVDSDIPSDLRGYWYIRYGLKPNEVDDLKKLLKIVIENMDVNPEKSDSPVSDFLSRSNLSAHSIENKNNLKKLTALETELSRNIIELSRKEGHTLGYSLLGTDCISHLLHTLYVDPGPQILAVAHELFQSYRLIRSDGNKYNHKTIEDILADTKRLMDMVAEIKQQLARGTLVEPEAPSPMIWRPSILDVFAANSVDKLCESRADAEARAAAEFRRICR